MQIEHKAQQFYDRCILPYRLSITAMRTVISDLRKDRDYRKKTAKSLAIELDKRDRERHGTNTAD